MSQERTEEQILARAPIILQFGGQSYEVPVLTILKARQWREKLIAEAKEIAGALNGDTNGRDESFFIGLGTVFLGFPEKMADLVFAYGPELPANDILESATEEELGIAFAQIMKVAFPFSRQLSLMNSIFQVGASLSASGKSTNSPSPSGASRRIQ